MPYSGPAAPPTLETSAIATVLSTAPGSACSAGAELLERLGHPAVHVRPVVAVADRGVERDKLGAVLGHLAGEPVHPVQRGVACDGHRQRDQTPQRRAGVFTGASQ